MQKIVVNKNISVHDHYSDKPILVKKNSFSIQQLLMNEMTFNFEKYVKEQDPEDRIVSIECFEVEITPEFEPNTTKIVFRAVVKSEKASQDLQTGMFLFTSLFDFEEGMLDEQCD